MTREHVDRGAAGTEVRHHLRGHFAGPRRHPGAHDAVVAREDGNRHGLGHWWWAFTRDRRQLHAERFKKTESPLGLRQPILQCARGQRRRLISRRYAAYEFVEGLFSHIISFSVSTARR